MVAAVKNLDQAEVILKARREQLLALEGDKVTPAVMDEIESLTLVLDRAKAHVRSPLVSKPGMSGPPGSQTIVAIGPDGKFREISPAGAAAANPRLARNLFRQEPETHGFTSAADVGRAILTGDSQRLVMLSGQSVGVPADGGYAMPTAFAFEIMDGSLESEVVRPRCRNVSMPAAEFVISAFDDSSHDGGSLFGGLEGQWLSEGGELDYKVAKLRQVVMRANKLGFLTAASNELLTDAPGFEGQFAGRMQQALGFNVDRACLVTGTGAGQPLSVLNSTATITVAKETSQTADTLLWENLVKMFSRLHPACMGNAVWVVSQTCIPQLMQLTIPTGTSGTVVPVMTGSVGNFSILGLPVVFTEKLNPVGDLGDIMLVDFSKYAVGMFGNGMRLDRSQHVKFTTDETVWRLIIRFCGQPFWTKAFTPVNGDTLSWAVTLAARA